MTRESRQRNFMGGPDCVPATGAMTGDQDTSFLRKRQLLTTNGVAYSFLPACRARYAEWVRFTNPTNLLSVLQHPTPTPYPSNTP